MKLLLLRPVGPLSRSLGQQK